MHTRRSDILQSTIPFFHSIHEMTSSVKHTQPLPKKGLDKPMHLRQDTTYIYQCLVHLRNRLTHFLMVHILLSLFARINFMGEPHVENEKLLTCMCDSFDTIGLLGLLSPQ